MGVLLLVRPSVTLVNTVKLVVFVLRTDFLIIELRVLRSRYVLVHWVVLRLIMLMTHCTLLTLV